MHAIGLYVHVPFCRHKCAYCDFVSYAGLESLHAPYLAAVREEMAWARAAVVEAGARAGTLYVGGGTPTVLPAEDLAALIGAARASFGLDADAEVTVEANPGTVSQATLRALRAAGVNRLSLGVQSFHDHVLGLLGRVHDAAEARDAVRAARDAGIENLSLDLMFGLPGQTMSGWREDVRQALALAPAHLSLYALTVEAGTPLAAWIDAGTLPAPDEDLAAEMYEWAEGALGQAGLVHYEISNWALPGCACRHNLVYWRNEPYLGLGAGAHSWWDGVRRANLPDPRAYVDAIRAGRAPVAEQERIDRALEMGETMMMGLRLLEEGVSMARFEARYGLPLEEVYGAEIAHLVARGLLERAPAGAPERIRLTERGHLLGNQVFAAFLPDPP
ncbi:MAG: radical SAM family heme chaperone HemW [Anaerolineae bacterium]|nr:radical SAM family heme chaperone HemW [Anaerolineae bacterium]